jgi:exodeoxyribonuclease VII small subunit
MKSRKQGGELDLMERGGTGEGRTEGTAGPSSGPPGDMSFEALVEGVEKVVAALQEGSLPLDRALEAYESGFGMLRAAEERLAAARTRLEVLKKNRVRDE